ncbi:MAG: Uma2 family endonuclease [Thermomicrobiales bacterium]
MDVARRISETEYERFILSTPRGTWELHDGMLIEKPAMSPGHRAIVSRLAQQLLAQLDLAEYAVRVNDGRIRGPAGTVLIPDLLVVPAGSGELADSPSGSPIIAAPLPLVVEVWSPASDGYDVDSKLPVYHQRGDLEIWRLQPGDRTLTTWVRQVDGTYAETIYQVGAALPSPRVGQSIDRQTRFDA